MRLVVIDASSFKSFYEELIGDIYSNARRLVDRVFENDFIGVDSGERILTEWIKCCCGDQDEFLRSWFRARAEEDKIRILDYNSSSQIKSSLKNFGVPRKDCTYMYFAASNSAFLLVSEDIDFFEPAAKTHNEQRKARIKSKRSGCVCKYMKSEHSVQICDLAGAEALL